MVKIKKVSCLFCTKDKLGSALICRSGEKAGLVEIREENWIRLKLVAPDKLAIKQHGSCAQGNSLRLHTVSWVRKKNQTSTNYKLSLLGPDSQLSPRYKLTWRTSQHTTWLRWKIIVRVQIKHYLPPSLPSNPDIWTWQQSLDTCKNTTFPTSPCSVNTLWEESEWGHENTTTTTTTTI